MAAASRAGEHAGHRVIPCLDVDDGRVVKGVNFENLRDAGDPVELAAALRRRGRRRVDLPGRDRIVGGPGHHARGGAPDGRAGVHPADRRRGGADGRGCRRAAASRRGQGVGEHRRDRATGPAGRDGAPVRLAVHRAVRGRPHGARGVTADAVGLGGHHPRRPPRGPVSTPWRGPPGAPTSGSGRSC